MPEFRASVLIPVKNGGALLDEVLQAVLSQRTEWPFEVLVIDSGSSDGSVELVRRHGVRCDTIEPKSFGHGRTRNQLAHMAAGEFLVYITQDAKPASERWLQSLVDICNSEPNVAGAFGPHMAYPSARYVTRRELAEHFKGFGPVNSIVKMDDPQRFRDDPGYRQWLHFFSSNNACIRKSVWESMPLPEVAFAEDQTWALQAIKAGYAKAYSPEAVVFHSHDFGVWETLQRNFDEARCFALYFGYRLQPSLPRALAAAVLLTRRDAKWLREHSEAKWVSKAMYMGCIEVARMVGQYLGTRHAGLPKFLSRAISRDEGLQRTGVA